MIATDGHASPVIAGGKLIYLDGQEGQETAHCVDAATGKELWRAAVGPLVEFSNYGSGPRCTPIIDGDRVYLQSSGGEFRCVFLADGKVAWGKSFAKDYGVTFLGNRSDDPAAKETASRRHGHNGSAAILDDRIFVPVGSVEGATLVAFDKKTGKELWRAGTDNTAYSSVMAGTLCMSEPTARGSNTPPRDINRCSGLPVRRVKQNMAGESLPSENSAMALWLEAGRPKNSTQHPLLPAY